MIKRRGNGILLHITSLPSMCGIGGLGPWAYKFADFLTEAKQNFWQILPLNPPGRANFNSPYSSLSAFGANTLLISAEMLAQEGLLAKEELGSSEDFSPERVDYNRAADFKRGLLDKAYEQFKTAGKDQEFERFCRENVSWLEDFAAFVAISEHFHWQSWDTWPAALRDRHAAELESARQRFAERINKERFFQYAFFRQWFALKEYCNHRNIQIIGDIPIYIDFNSADAWANPQIFKLDADKRPSVVAGVPPDYFSKTGQRWGNPVYDWDALKKEGYKWWIDRIGHNLKLFDSMRIDHFRGLVQYWEVPASETTAIKGKWVDAGGEDFFNTLFKRFAYPPIIAEDLGIITPDVREFMHRYEFPGMKVLLFAFDESMPKNAYITHNIPKNSLVYTGTHDNNTVRGWFERDATQADKERIAQYLGFMPKAETVSWDFIRLAMMSAGNAVIVPMQDLLGLGQEARMNMPSTCEGNWSWRLLPSQLTPDLAQKLADMTHIYGRD